MRGMPQILAEAPLEGHPRHRDTLKHVGDGDSVTGVLADEPQRKGERRVFDGDHVGRHPGGHSQGGISRSLNSGRPPSISRSSNAAAS